MDDVLKRYSKDDGQNGPPTKVHRGNGKAKGKEGNGDANKGKGKGKANSTSRRSGTQGGKAASSSGNNSHADSGSVEDRLHRLESIVTTACKQIMANSLEIRRQCREKNLALVFRKGCVLTEIVHKARRNWEHELAQADEDTPTTQFKAVAWQVIWGSAANVLKTPATGIENPEEHATRCLNLASAHNVVVRFYALRLKSSEEDAKSEKSGDVWKDDEDSNRPDMIWIVRFPDTERGRQTAKLLKDCNAHNTLDALKLDLRGDQAPRSGMERAIQQYLDSMH